MAMSVLEASKFARFTHKWAGSTRSIGLAVIRNGRERVYHFNRSGHCVAWETPEGQLVEWGPFTVSRDGHMY